MVPSLVGDFEMSLESDHSPMEAVQLPERRYYITGS